MFYFYPCLRKRGLTHHNAKVIISASHVRREKLCVCPYECVEDRERQTELQQQW